MFFTNFEKLCKSKHKSSTAVGIELGISKTTISYWRNKPTVIPKQDVLLRIADYFGVTVDYLLGKEKTSAKNSEGDIVTYRVAAMGGMDGDEIRTIDKNQMNKWAELIEATRELPPEKIDMLIKMAESIK